MTEPTQDPPESGYNMAFRHSVSSTRHLGYGLTPARTLVMSRTRMPANGNVRESEAAVASPRRHKGHIEPLSREPARIGLASLKAAINEAMTLFNFFARESGEEGKSA